MKTPPQASITFRLLDRIENTRPSVDRQAGSPIIVAVIAESHDLDGLREDGMSSPGENA